MKLFQTYFIRLFPIRITHHVFERRDAFSSSFLSVRMTRVHFLQTTSEYRILCKRNPGRDGMYIVYNYVPPLWNRHQPTRTWHAALLNGFDLPWWHSQWTVIMEPNERVNLTFLSGLGNWIAEFGDVAFVTIKSRLRVFVYFIRTNRFQLVMWTRRLK